tara:strand:- start:1149 stop:1508 length:360 start_codon:yes stop_codon:yes gene_type:complete
MLNLILIGLGGAFGAMSRFGVNIFFQKYLLISTIYGTLFVNILGCFLIGLILGISLPEKNSSYYFFIIGFLGSFTTMSAFTHQAVLLFNSNLINSLSYIMLTILLSLMATYAGVLISKQ